MRIKSVVDDLTLLWQIQGILNHYEEEYGKIFELGPTLKHAKKINASYINIELFPETGYQHGFGFLFDNIVFFPWGVKDGEDHFLFPHRNLAIYITNETHGNLEVYGWFKYKKEIKIFGITVSPVKYVFGWREKGPWVKHIKLKAKAIRKEFKQLFNEIHKYNKELAKKRKLERKLKTQENIKKFGKGFEK